MTDLYPEPDPEDVAACTCANLRKTMRAVTQTYDAALQPVGLTATQFTILATLARQGAAPISRLAEALVTDRTTLTRNLRPLLRKGLVRIAAEDDQRVRRVGLTEAGESALETARPHWEAIQARIPRQLGHKRWSELLDALKKANRDADTRVIVVTGAGKAFSSGQDLGELQERYVPGYVPELSRDLHKRYNPIVKRICGMDKPVIAAVGGVAAGAGFSLALACDLRIASEKASFVQVFVNVGLIPDSGSSYFLPRLVGHAKAMELCCTGRPVKAPEALELGLVNRVVPPDELGAAADEMAALLASKPARSLALTKRLLHQSLDNDLSQQLEAEAFAQETAGMTADHHEGVVAFIEKRKPSFTGR